MGMPLGGGGAPKPNYIQAAQQPTSAQALGLMPQPAPMQSQAPMPMQGGVGMGLHDQRPGTPDLNMHPLTPVPQPNNPWRQSAMVRLLRGG